MPPLEENHPLIENPHAPREPQQGLNRGVVYGVLAFLSIGGLIALFLGAMRLTAPPQPSSQTVPQDPPPMTTPAPALDPFVKDMRFSFAHYDRRPQETPPPVAPPIQPQFADFKPDRCPTPRIGSPPNCTCPPGTIEPSCTPPKAETKTETKPETKPATTPAKTQPVQAKEKQKQSEDWLFATIKGSSRRGSGTGGGGSGSPEGGNPPDGNQGPRQGRGSHLFPAAQWERPARPERVIYSSQIMNCLLEQAIRTGQDGTVRCKLTETLYDKFGQLETLAPLHSLIMGKVSGANVKPGQTTVPISVEKIELPDGTDLPLTGKMGGADGISGVPGKVDNRIPQVVLTAVLSAAASIGTRSITGNTQGYNPTLGQEYTADVAQSLSRSGEDIMKRTLSIDPLINIKAQDPVTIQLDNNISLMSPPRIVYR